MRSSLLVCGLAFLAGTLAPGGEHADAPRKQVYLWVWWKNLEGQWRELIDFAAAFAASGKSADSFYWPIDAHFNAEGNVFVGEYLSKQELAAP